MPFVMKRAASISEKSVWRFSIGLQIASQSLAGRIIAAARRHPWLMMMLSPSRLAAFSAYLSRPDPDVRKLS